MKTFLIFIYLTCHGMPLLFAQRDLKLIDDGIPPELLGNSKNKIERATLTRENEKSVTISLRCSGFDDKQYTIQMGVLNSRKEIIRNIPMATLDMPKNRQVDHALSLSNSDATSSQQFIQSKFLRVRINPVQDGVLGALDDLLGDVSLSSTEYLFELDKKWMLTGENVKVSVKLVPFKSATSIPMD